MIDSDAIMRYAGLNKYIEHDINTVKEAFVDYRNQGCRNGKTNGDYYRHLPPIKKVIFNNPATIVFWADGTKTVVKRSDKDEWDPEKGLAMAIVKKLFARNQFLKMIPKETWEGKDNALEKKERLIEQIQGKTPEEIYDFLYWLLITYGNQFTDSRQAVISWLTYSSLVRRDDDGAGV